MDKIKFKASDWKNSNVHVFWGELAPTEHMVQIYENDQHFLNTLEGFAGTGFIAGDSVIIIATKEHRDGLNTRLEKQGFDVDNLVDTHQYIALDAEETLSKFMIDQWPCADLFNACIPAVIKKAQKNNRKVRAFGEMVALLWSKGMNGATVQLENLWNQLHTQNNFSLFCAYPKSGFTQCPTASINTICSTHSRIIDGQSRPATEIYHRKA